MTPPVTAQTASAESAREALLALRAELAKAVVGQEGVVSGLVIALLCRGHVLLEGVPGVAKTLLVRALSAALQLQFKRVQFTPDLMPGDVTGSLVYDTRTAAFTFRYTAPVTRSSSTMASEPGAPDFRRYRCTAWIRFRITQEKPGAILAQCFGFGLGVGLGVAEADCDDGDEPSASCWLAGVNMLHPASVRAASRPQHSTPRRRAEWRERVTGEGTPARIRVTW